jgi:DNA-binding NarL/FixJ family response regulator
VLIVDDAPVFREVARELLEARGYEVAGEADSAAGALEAVERLAPDAVMLDVQLPDGDGFELSAKIAGTAAAPRVLLVSADRTQPDPERLERSKASGFALKTELGRTDLTAFWPAPRD